ncbi:uncharacterized protein SPAPADRAFT_136686 [Spathaspora passalidarum NRRL Y-27907]|uniref:Uncharacterized protein n=1 Tax=Spathaspora passalidarum (strain NRRL Y-27907 / 11-Y1) TaxID=619300 RepID=G3AMP4_SPAPN|nr:uncharacterized protein SPAPADRAFT_136686 [Spathaspora passalidarum NRRL Y-27907]EGW33489.1 hypothetical protein SPAPADRAFT_136686 [Spathaspora passalidarum NRRL Y-27907]
MIRIIPRNRTLFRCQIVKPVSLLRWNSTASPFAYVQDFNQLSQKVNETITSSSTNETIISALKAFKMLQHSYPLQDQLDSKSKLTKDCLQIIDEVFSKDVQFSSELLKEILLLNLPTELNLKLINHYYRLNPDAVIDKETALVALRNALFNGDFFRAIKVSDVTVGHPNYIKKNQDILKKGFFKLVGSAAGITILTKLGINTAIETGMVSPAWQHIVALNSVLLTYLVNSTFLVSIVKFGRQMTSAGGDYLTWQKGTFYTHWFKHADEMLFGAKILEADRDLNGGQNNPEIVEELCRPAPIGAHGVTHSLSPGYDREGNKIRLLEAKDNLEDLTFQAYWMSGGDGFEWVEPDQDPAEIAWKDHIQQYHKPQLQGGGNNAGALKWADELIEKSSDEKELK